MNFKGWIVEAEKKDTKKPWEKFRVCLLGETIGELFDDSKIIRRILKVSGYELILRETDSGIETKYP